MHWSLILLINTPSIVLFLGVIIGKIIIIASDKKREKKLKFLEIENKIKRLEDRIEQLSRGN